MAILLALDAGTTSIRCLAVDESAQVIDHSHRELTQSFPQPGWVEHDPQEILRLAIETLSEVARRIVTSGQTIAGLGITNQRETVVAWDRATGLPLAPAIVWQDRRTAERCAELRDLGLGQMIRSTTGLMIDPYFSATKMEWLLGHGVMDRAAQPALGTIDSWLIWNLTGSFVTEPSNAARTMLCDLDSGTWSPELCRLFGIPANLLPEIIASASDFGSIIHPDLPALTGIRIEGVLGDQQAALFGQCCFTPGMVKATYGTGAFVLVNAGEQRPQAVDGLVTTIAWTLDATTTYALEGSAFVAGAAIQWLRDGLGVIDRADQLEALALSDTATERLAFIPAFAGLGSPWWDEGSRGALVGITKGSNRAALANAVVHSLAFEVRAMVDVMASGLDVPIKEIRLDGGASVMDLLAQRLANQSATLICRPRSLETTALGAATLAGLRCGVFADQSSLGELWEASARFDPEGERDVHTAHYEQWLDALQRARAIGSPPSST